MPASTYRLLALALATIGCSSQDPLPNVASPSSDRAGHDIARPEGVDAEGAATGGTDSAPAVEDAAGAPSAAGGADAPTPPVDCQPNQPILTGAVTNARDFGGTPLA